MHMADALISPAVGGAMWVATGVVDRLQRAQGARRPRREQDPADGRRRRLRLRRADAQLHHPRHGLERPPRRGADARHPAGAGGRLPRDGLDPRRPGAVLRRRRPARARLPTSSTSASSRRSSPTRSSTGRIVGRRPELARAASSPAALLAADRRTAARRLRRGARDDRLRHHRAAVLDLRAAHAADPPRHRRRRGARHGGRRALRLQGAARAAGADRGAAARSRGLRLKPVCRAGRRASWPRRSPGSPRRAPTVWRSIAQAGRQELDGLLAHEAAAGCRPTACCPTTVRGGRGGGEPCSRGRRRGRRSTPAPVSPASSACAVVAGVVVLHASARRGRPPSGRAPAERARGRARQ